MPDGNLAFKVTWVYGRSGPFTGTCTAEGRDINIRHDRKVWCNQPENKCYQIWQKGNQGPPVPVGDWACNDSMIFKEWSFSAGAFHHGLRKDSFIRIRHAKPGKLAFFTAKNRDMAEEDRIVIGCYRIAAISPSDDGELWVESAPGTRIRVPDFSKAPRFWNFHTQSGGPRWGTGLFRYLTDSEASRLYAALKATQR